jgi:hypothetical protein
VGGVIISFIVIVNWTMLQVSVAVLLDNFVSETAREKDAEMDIAREKSREKDNMGNVLDPLLKTIASEYVDENHLAEFLRQLFGSMCSSVSQVSNDSTSAHDRALGRQQVCDAFSLVGYTHICVCVCATSHTNSCLVYLSSKSFLASISRLLISRSSQSTARYQMSRG